MGHQAKQVQHQGHGNIYLMLATISTTASHWPSEAARKGKLQPFVQSASRVTGCKCVIGPVSEAVKDTQ